MEQENYGYSKNVEISFEQAVSKIKELLRQEGFGILTEIDVKETLKKKLDINYENYIILGACNPPLAYKALQAEKEIGLLLPCNVIIYTTYGKTIVSAINPIIAMSMISNPALKKIAEEAKNKLKKVIESV